MFWAIFILKILQQTISSICLFLNPDTNPKVQSQDVETLHMTSIHSEFRWLYEVGLCNLCCFCGLFGLCDLCGLCDLRGRKLTCIFSGVKKPQNQTFLRGLDSYPKLLSDLELRDKRLGDLISFNKQIMNFALAHQRNKFLHDCPTTFMK